MSDHKDSPFIDELPMVDIGDHFMWIGQSGGPVFMMSLNPLTDPNPRVTSEIHLDAKAIYEFKIVLDGGAVPQLTYKISVSGNVPTQHLTLRKATGAAADNHHATGEIVAQGESTEYGKPPNIIVAAGGEKLFVGPCQDPFFFNFKGVVCPVSDDLRFALGADGLPSDGTSDDTFGPTNVTGIVLEVPELKGAKIGSWSVTADPVAGKPFDRAGRASITAIFLPRTPTGRNDACYPYGDYKQPYNETEPRDDVKNYGHMFQYRLGQLQADEKLADFFLPDILTLDPAQAQVYPNGRSLTEDAVYWMIKELNPFMYVPPGAGLPAVSQQALPKDFPYVQGPVSSFPYLDLEKVRAVARKHHANAH